MFGVSRGFWLDVQGRVDAFSSTLNDRVIRRVEDEWSGQVLGEAEPEARENRCRL